MVPADAARPPIRPSAVPVIPAASTRRRVGFSTRGRPFDVSGEVEASLPASLPGRGTVEQLYGADRRRRPRRGQQAVILEVEGRQLRDPAGGPVDGPRPALAVERRARLDDPRRRPRAATSSSSPHVPMARPARKRGAERGRLDDGRDLDRPLRWRRPGPARTSGWRSCRRRRAATSMAMPLSASAASTRSAPRWATPSSTARTICGPAACPRVRPSSVPRAP